MFSRPANIAIEVQEGDALEFEADVLAVKFAQQHYGVDRAVAAALQQHYPNLSDILPKVDGFRLLESRGSLAAAGVLFVGVKPLREFGYPDIRGFGRKVLVSLAGEVDRCDHGRGHSPRGGDIPREQGQNTLRQLLKFVCPTCLAEMKDRFWPAAQERETAEAQKWLANIEAQRNLPRPVHGVRMVMLNDRHIEIRCGDCVIGMVDFDGGSSRLRVILGDAYIGTGVPHMWTGGPAAVEIDLRGGIEEMLGSRGAPNQ